MIEVEVAIQTLEVEVNVCATVIGTGGDATVENSDASYIETVASGDTLVLPDTEYDIYVNTVFNQTFTAITLKDETINIS